jgi:transcriptional regulator with XRE-family HTH domain
MKEETSPETIQRVLSEFELGRKLRRLRLRKKITLGELAKHTGLSASMLSQLENGKLIPTLPTLARIGMVFDVSVDHFFNRTGGPRLFAVVRSSERMRFPELPDAPAPSYFFECLTFASQGQALQAYLVDFPAQPRPPAREHVHDGVEFLFVLEGRVAIRYQDEDREIDAGDAVLLDSSVPHSYRCAGEQASRALVVTSVARS